jgi:hypothetical protein
MNFDEFSWKRDTREVLFKPMTGSSLGSATFESDKFFNYQFWEELQGMNNIHPLVALWQYSKGIGFDQFPVVNYANYLRMESSQVRHQLMQLSRLGFIYFDDAADIVKINPKINYFLNASVGKTDYDVMYFTSNTKAPQENARLNLDDYDLTVNGVQNIFLSDSQKVVVIPERNQLILKKNRNLKFDGIVNAGLITCYGSNFFFEYDSFKIDMQRIDSIRFNVKLKERDNFGQPLIKEIDNVIELVTGELLIDDPANKSGIKKFSKYPLFLTKDNAYVYFDKKSIQNGVYKRDQVYFKVYPFSMDSINNFDKNGMQIRGLFVSGGILPPLEQTLTLSADYSLGFTYKTPEQGIPVYNGAGSFYNTLEMSSNGLHGSGTLEYITSTTTSDDFLFHPDSLMTISREFKNSKQTEGTPYPLVSSAEN